MGKNILLVTGNPPPPSKFFLLASPLQADSQPRGLHTGCLGVEALGRKSGDQGSHPSPNTNQLWNSRPHSESQAMQPDFLPGGGSWTGLSALYLLQSIINLPHNPRASSSEMSPRPGRYGGRVRACAYVFKSSPFRRLQPPCTAWQSVVKVCCTVDTIFYRVWVVDSSGFMNHMFSQLLNLAIIVQKQPYLQGGHLCSNKTL